MELRINDLVSKAISLQSHPGSLSDVAIEGIKNDIYNCLSLDLEKMVKTKLAEMESQLRSPEQQVLNVKSTS
jgi:hypothetical protein